MRLGFMPAVRFGNTTPPQQPVTIQKAQEELVNLLMGVPRYGVNSVGATGAPGSNQSQCTILAISIQKRKFETPVINAIAQNGGQKTPNGVAQVLNVPIPTPVSYKGFPVTIYAPAGQIVPHGKP